MKKSVLALGLAAATALGSVAAIAETNSMNIAGYRIANPFDSSTWWDGAEGKADMASANVDVNFADPDFWFGFMKPEEHSVRHMAFTNPATWAQFMRPATYAKMADVDTWMKWADLASYDVVTDPQTYAYWSQPGAYMHVMKAEHYGQAMSPDAYGAVVSAALDLFGMTMPGNIGKEMIGPATE